MESIPSLMAQLLLGLATLTTQIAKENWFEAEHMDTTMLSMEPSTWTLVLSS